MENMAQENLILHIGEGISGFDAGNFKSVSVDGSPLDSADYDVENGSILLTIHRDYLNRLIINNNLYRESRPKKHTERSMLFKSFTSLILVKCRPIALLLSSLESVRRTTMGRDTRSIMKWDMCAHNRYS